MSDETQLPQLTKRQFLRRVVVGSGTVMLVAGDYLRPELETLLGPQVAQAKGSGYPNWPRNRDWPRDRDWPRHRRRRRRD